MASKMPARKLTAFALTALMVVSSVPRDALAQYVQTAQPVTSAASSAASATIQGLTNSVAPQDNAAPTPSQDTAVPTQDEAATPSDVAQPEQPAAADAATPEQPAATPSADATTPATAPAEAPKAHTLTWALYDVGSAPQLAQQDEPFAPDQAAPATGALASGTWDLELGETKLAEGVALTCERAVAEAGNFFVVNLKVSDSAFPGHAGGYALRMTWDDGSSFVAHEGAYITVGKNSRQVGDLAFDKNALTVAWSDPDAHDAQELYLELYQGDAVAEGKVTDEQRKAEREEAERQQAEEQASREAAEKAAAEEQAAREAAEKAAAEEQAAREAAEKAAAEEAARQEQERVAAEQAAAEQAAADQERQTANDEMTTSNSSTSILNIDKTGSLTEKLNPQVVSANFQNILSQTLISSIGTPLTPQLASNASCYIWYWKVNSGSFVYSGTNQLFGSSTSTVTFKDISFIQSKTGYHGYWTGKGRGVSSTVKDFSENQTVKKTDLPNTSNSTYMMAVGNIDIFPNYEANTYTVKYNGNNNTGGSTASSSHTYDTAKNLTANGFTRTGYQFKNWNKNAAGTSSTYGNKASVKNLTTTNGGTVTLYAQWDAETYPIYINFNGGWGTVQTATVASNASETDKTSPIQITNNTLKYGTSNYSTLYTGTGAVTRTGYTIQGGYTAATGGTQLWNANGSCAKDGTYFNSSGNWCKDLGNNNTSFYAYLQWKANTYTIKYNYNWPANRFSATTAGSTADSSHTYDTAKALTENKFTCTAWDFQGWNTASDGTGTSYTDKQSVKNLTTESGKTITLYAQWTPWKRTLRYNGNGGKTDDNKTSVDVPIEAGTHGGVNNKFQDVGFSRYGYSQLGWAEDPSTANQYSINNNVNDGWIAKWTSSTPDGVEPVVPIDLYATWQPATYYVAYKPGDGGTGGKAVTHKYDTPQNAETGESSTCHKSGYQSQ